MNRRGFLIAAAAAPAAAALPAGSAVMGGYAGHALALGAQQSGGLQPLRVARPIRVPRLPEWELHDKLLRGEYARVLWLREWRRHRLRVKHGRELAMPASEIWARHRAREIARSKNLINGGMTTESDIEREAFSRGLMRIKRLMAEAGFW